MDIKASRLQGIKASSQSRHQWTACNANREGYTITATRTGSRRGAKSPQRRRVRNDTARHRVRNGAESATTQHGTEYATAQSPQRHSTAQSTQRHSTAQSAQRHSTVQSAQRYSTARLRRLLADCARQAARVDRPQVGAQLHSQISQLGLEGRPHPRQVANLQPGARTGGLRGQCQRADVTWAGNRRPLAAMVAAG